MFWRDSMRIDISNFRQNSIRVIEVKIMVDREPPCVMCGRIRMLLILGAVVFLLFSTQPESDFLIGVDVSKGFAWLLAGVFILMVIWKFYNEYWKTKSAPRGGKDQ